MSGTKRVNIARVSFILIAMTAITGYGQTTPPQTLAKTAAPEPTIKFDIVSLKPCDEADWRGKVTEIPADGDFVAIRCQPMTRLFNFAFSEMGAYQIKNEPEWVDTVPYDFRAKVAPEDIATWQKMTVPSKRLMARAMLVDVLSLRMHVEQQSRPVYALIQTTSGPKLGEHKPGPDDPPPSPNPSVHAEVHWLDRYRVSYTNASMTDLAVGMSARLDRPVVNETGLAGRYDFIEEHLPYPSYDPKSPEMDTSEIPAILDGVKSLGLKLESKKAPVQVLVIDHIERPQAN